MFEQQAGLILNQQLEALASLSFAAQSEEALAARLDKLTDPALLLAKTPGAARAVLEKINTQLPDWLQRANADDRFAYHRHLQDMAQVLKKTVAAPSTRVSSLFMASAAMRCVGRCRPIMAIATRMTWCWILP